MITTDFSMKNVLLSSFQMCILKSWGAMPHGQYLFTFVSIHMEHPIPLSATLGQISLQQPQDPGLVYTPESFSFVGHHSHTASFVFTQPWYVVPLYVNGKIQFFCSFELCSFTKHCKMLLMFENRFRNMTKDKIRNFMFWIKCFLVVVVADD